MALTLTAAQVPLPMVPASILLLAGAPPVWTYFASGDLAGGAAAKSKKSAVHGTEVAKYGAGFYAVGSGLTLSAGSGLTLSVAAGQAIIDGVVEISTATDYVLPNNATSRVWLQRDGTLTHKTDLTQPATPSVFLGTVTTLSGAITTIDTSGIVSFVGGAPMRTTADTDKPGDSPSSSLSFWTKTSAGLWLWDGTEYRLEPHGIMLGRTTVPASLTDGVPSGFEATVYGPVTVLGTLYNFGDLRVTG